MDPEGGAEHGAGDRAGPVPADGTPRDAMLSDATPPGPEPLVAEEFAAEWSDTVPPAEAERPASADDLARADDDTQTIEPAPRPGLLARAGAGLAVAARRVTGPGTRRVTRRGPRRVRRPADPDREDVAGSALARLTILPALLILAWLLPGLPLLLAGEFVPVPMLLIATPLLVGLVSNGLRVVPSRWPRLFPGQVRIRGWTSWFGLMATVAVAAGFAAWQLVELSESVIVLRSPGAYLQAGYWLAQHGSLPIPQSLAAFGGGAHAGLGFSSIGFFAHGSSVVPLGTSGLPMLLAGGFWAHGAAALGAVLGGFAVLSFGGLIARLAGPQWAPAGALVLGLSLPEQYVSRSAFTEPALQVLLFGGLCLLIDSLTLRADPPVLVSGWRRLVSVRTWSGAFTPERTMAALGGLALGLGLLVSLDSLIYLLPVIPFGGLLLVARRPGAAPFCLGVVLGAGYGLVDGYVLSRPFLDALSHNLALIGIIAAWLTALTAATVQLLRVPSARKRVAALAARRPGRWLPGLAALVTVAALVGFAVRPYVQMVRDAPGPAVFHYIAGLQRAQGLAVDPARTYAESTLYWVVWYIGLPAVLLGAFGMALLARQCVRALLRWRDPSGAWRNWALPLGITCVGSAASLWNPDILPDQPWASRRLVVLVLPGLIGCALWAAAWLTGHARNRGARAVTAAVAGLFCVGALGVPTAATAFGAGLTHSGHSAGLKVTASGLAFKRAGAGETSAVTQLCSSIQPNSSVVILDRTVAQQFTQVIRGTCGVPAAWMIGAPPTAVAGVLNGIARAGRQPVLLGARRGELAGFGGTPARVLDLVTTQDPHQLTSPPTALATIHFVIWMLAPRAGGTGA
ncbi:MAG TPA: hypothetical protein VK586_11515 [Streptosporangiaceae bacterium]|nr:hypothetical protein [Streptosporangiaceae bacterium]